MITDDPFPEGMVEEIERFFRTEHLREPGKDLYEEVFDSNLFFPLQRKGEMIAMMQEARRIEPTTVMEIGADKGGSLYHWCKCLPTVRNVIACEIRGLPYQYAFARAFPNINFLWLECSSYAKETVEGVKQTIHETPIDCIFMDGDKGEYWEDWKYYSPMMSKRGIVFMHDIKDQGGPRDTFQKVCDLGYGFSTVFDFTDSERALAREAAGMPCESAHEGWLRHWRKRSAGLGIIYMDRRRA